MAEGSELKTVHVAAAVIYRDGRVLACQRSASQPMAGGWEFPGGKVEAGETAQEACKRECAEELGVRLSPVTFFETIEYSYPSFHLVMDCFICSLVPGSEPEAREHAEVRWLSQDELLDVEWLPADLDFVQRLGRYWGQVFAFDDRF